MEGKVLLDCQGSPWTGFYKAIGRVEGLRTREIAAGWGYCQYNHGRGLQNPENGWRGMEAVWGGRPHRSCGRVGRTQLVHKIGREGVSDPGNKCSSITSLLSPASTSLWLNPARNKPVFTACVGQPTRAQSRMERQSRKYSVNSVVRSSLFQLAMETTSQSRLERPLNHQSPNRDPAWETGEYPIESHLNK